jgi:hypothetical protein
VWRFLTRHTCLDAGTVARVGGALLFSNANASGNPTKREFLRFMRLCEFVVNTDHAYSRPNHTAYRILTHACVIKWPPLYPKLAFCTPLNIKQTHYISKHADLKETYRVHSGMNFTSTDANHGLHNHLIHFNCTIVLTRQHSGHCSEATEQGTRREREKTGRR